MRCQCGMIVVVVLSLTVHAFAQAAPTSQPAAAANPAMDAYRADRKRALVVYRQAIVDADQKYIAALNNMHAYALQRGDTEAARNYDTERAEITEVAREDRIKLAATRAAPDGELVPPVQAISAGGKWVIILRATWGADDRTAEVSAAVRRMVAAGNTGFVTNELMGTDPYPGATKKLHIEAIVEGAEKTYDVWGGTSLPDELLGH